MAQNYQTPETNIAHSGLKLMRYKILVEVTKGMKYPSLSLDDVNEILVVANLPVVIPDEINVPELDIIKTEDKKEEPEE